MTDRINRLMKCMEEQQVDAILVADGCNMRYLSGFSGETGYLYVSGNHKVILTDSRYTTQAQEESCEFEVQEIVNGEGYAPLIAKLMQADQPKSLGFEEQVMIYGDVVSLQNKLPKTEWKGLGDSLNDLRMIKTEEEISYIAKAQQIGDEAFSHVLTVLRPGITELEVAAELESYMKRHGASGLAFDTIAASGYHSAMPHATPSDKVLEYGDFLTMDYGCKYKGYCADMTRTVVIGKANEQQKEIYQIVLDAQMAALDAIRAGITGAELDKVARDIIKNAGYGQYFGHSLGHSVGLFIHEFPRISPMGQTELLPGMTATIEPGIYVPGVGGVRIEDLVVVTENGCRNLTSSPKKLLEID